MSSLLEDQIARPAPTGTPWTTRESGRSDPSDALYGPVKKYPTTRPYVLLLEPHPAREGLCRASGWVLPCNRKAGHRGRHCWVFYSKGGVVRAVWGARTPVGPVRRVSAEEIAERLVAS